MGAVWPKRGKRRGETLVRWAFLTATFFGKERLTSGETGTDFLHLHTGQKKAGNRLCAREFFFGGTGRLAISRKKWRLARNVH